MPDWIHLLGRRLPPMLALLLSCAFPGTCQQTVAPGKFVRQILVPPLDHLTPVCTVLDGSAAAHTANGEQMTLWADDRPVPFTITINSPVESAFATAEVLNFRNNGKHKTTEFDLRMPTRPYSSVQLKLGQSNLVLHATVATEDGRPIGSFVLFEMSATGLGHNTTMQLGERQDATLHVTLDKLLPRIALLQVQVPPARSEETLFTTVASQAPLSHDGNSAATFHVEQGWPIERVDFRVGGSFEFHRNVVIQAVGANPLPDIVTGSIQRVRSVHEGTYLQTELDSIDAVLPDNQHGPMQVTVAVENGKLTTLPIDSIRLQMRQRQLCFTATPGIDHWQLYYGDPTVTFVPIGGRPRSLVQHQDPILVTMGPEQLASNFHSVTSPKDGHASRLFAVILLYFGLVALLVTLFLQTVRIPHVRR